MPEEKLLDISKIQNLFEDRFIKSKLTELRKHVKVYKIKDFFEEKK